MNQLSKGELVGIGLMMFSIFFGAGNLIFPPALGQAAGDHAIPAMIGFLVTGVGMPFIGIVAIALQGGKYIEFIGKVTSLRFASGLLAVLYLTIGPGFAIPRTGAVSFEIGVRPFLAPESITIGMAGYTALFFIATFFLALNPNKLIDRVGKVLTPILLVFLAIMFAKSFITPLGDVMAATGKYIDAPFTQGFLDGYQTMDMLASIAIGTIIINSVRARGVEDPKALGKICVFAGIISITLMSIVYLSLTYLGATSASVLGLSANGGQLLASAVTILFGPAGNMVLGVVICLACLTTSCGLVSGSSWFFNRLLGNRISYERLALIFTLFSFAVSNVGLTQIIALAVPFLVAIYPVVIVLVLTSLFSGAIGTRYTVYRCAAYIALVFALVDALNAANLKIDALDQFFTAYLPLYPDMMGWVVPSIVGVIVGLILSAVRGEGSRAL